MRSRDRITQHQISDVVDQTISSLADALSQGADPASLADSAIPLLLRLSDPDDPINRSYFGVVDEDITNAARLAQDTGRRAAKQLLHLYQTYGAQLDPESQAKVIFMLNPRLAMTGHAPLPVPDLTPDQVSRLDWQYQMAYQDAKDPGWRDRLPPPESPPPVITAP